MLEVQVLVTKEKSWVFVGSPKSQVQLCLDVQMDKEKDLRLNFQQRIQDKVPSPGTTKGFSPSPSPHSNETEPMSLKK